MTDGAASGRYESCGWGGYVGVAHVFVQLSMYGEALLLYNTIQLTRNM